MCCVIFLSGLLFQCNDRNIPKEQIRKLLQLLPKRGQEKFIEFCFALDATGQRKIVTDDLKLDLQQLQMMKGKCWSKLEDVRQEIMLI